MLHFNVGKPLHIFRSNFSAITFGVGGNKLQGGIERSLRRMDTSIYVAEYFAVVWNLTLFIRCSDYIDLSKKV